MVKRCDIYLADLGSGFGSIQNGIRPVVIVQNDTGNLHSPTTIVCPLTSKNKRALPTHTGLTHENSGVAYSSIVLCEQLMVIDKFQLIKRLSTIDSEELIEDINRKIKASLGL